jgi:hypothetical protein
VTCGNWGYWPSPATQAGDPENPSQLDVLARDASGFSRSAASDCIQLTLMLGPDVARVLAQGNRGDAKRGSRICNRPKPAENATVDQIAPTDAQIEAALLELVAQRGPLSSACPSEAARSLSPSAWRMLMPRVREVAARLAQAGLLDISQRGRSVSPQGPWRGPIRVRLPFGDKNIP